MNERLLYEINSPADVRALSHAELGRLAGELREFILRSVSRTGGHLSANLGSVELTIALHHVFELPHDRLVWDVGHQSYPHKILTGRRDRMESIRRLGGLSGFPRRDESEYDAFGTAHASTSISAVLGMATGAMMKGEQRHAIAVIGDGALSGGMAFEALNNAGISGAKVIVVLNDNEMSISPPVGALHDCLMRLLNGSFYAAARDTAKAVLRNAPVVYDPARRLEEHVKGQAGPSGSIFSEFGFNYVGPVDGHDLPALVEELQAARVRSGPQFVHVVTRKGCGYVRAERDPVMYHGTGQFDPEEGIVKSAATPKPTFTAVFGQWLCDMAQADERLVGITPAMREGSGLVEFERRFPARYHDVGIAEQHAVTFAAGLACEGAKPVVAIYSTFLQRAYDQLIHDVAIQNLPVLFAVDRAGLVGPDGATHAGAYDIAFLRCIPNLSVLTPSDENECRQALYTAFRHDGPAAVRYPRGSGVGVTVESEMTAIPFGKGERRREASVRPASGRRVAILAFGTLLHEALKAADRLDASVVNMRFVKPLDVALVLELACSHDAFVTIEDGCIAGGAGSAVAEALLGAGLALPMLMLGFPDAFITHGDASELMTHCGLDAAGIEDAVHGRFPAVASSSHRVRQSDALVANRSKNSRSLVPS